MGIFYPSKKELNICDQSYLMHYIKKHQINSIINTAAYTQVDLAEKEMSSAYAVNEGGVKNLLSAAKIENIKVIFFSTDYVFNSHDRDLYVESDSISPRGVYAKSKAAGEALINKSDFPTVLIRTSWLFSPYGHNFVKSILRIH